MELMVALTIGVLLVGLGAPMAQTMYETMQYRESVRNISGAASGARIRALNSGRAMDLMIEPEAWRYAVQTADTPFDPAEATELVDSLRIGVESARELTIEDGVAVIRFFPDGSSSGGSITLRRESGQGVRVRVDWLLGRVTHETPESS